MTTRNFSTIRFPFWASRSSPIRPSGTSISDLTPGSPLIGKGNTNITPLVVVPIDPTYGATEVTPPGADLGCYQLNGTGNQH